MRHQSVQGEKTVESISRTEGRVSCNLIMEVTSYRLCRVPLFRSKSLLATMARYCLSFWTQKLCYNPWTFQLQEIIILSPLLALSPPELNFPSLATEREYSHTVGFNKYLMSEFKGSAEELISNFRTLKAGDPRNNTQGLANFFCKQPASKYFRLCGPHGLCHD